MTVGTDQRALDELCVNTIRTLSMDAVQAANSGHPGTPMALAPIAYLLYTRVMRHSPSDPDWPGRDRFVLSCGHASMLLYSTLTSRATTSRSTRSSASASSTRRARATRSTATSPGSRPPPARSARASPPRSGWRSASACSPPASTAATTTPVDHFTYFIASDGDMEEGIASEASSIAGHLGLGKLIGFYDDNHISIEGDTKLSFSEDVGARYEAYGWHVQNLGEEIELDRLEAALRVAQEVEDRPSLIIVRTHIAPGSPNKQDTHGAHGSPLGEEEIRLTKRSTATRAWTRSSSPTRRWSTSAARVERGREQQAEWEEAFARTAPSTPTRPSSSSASTRTPCPRALAPTRRRRAPTPA